MKIRLFFISITFFILFIQHAFSNTQNIIYDIDTIIYIKKDTIFNENIILNFKSQGELFINENIEVTILGKIVADRKLIFGGNGNIILEGSKIESVYPEWWGALPNDTVCDSYAIEKAIESNLNVILSRNSKYILKESIDVIANKVSINGESTCQLSKIEVYGEIDPFIFSGLLVDSFIVTQDLNINQESIFIDRIPKIDTGNIILLKSNKLWYYDNRDYLLKGEVTAVKEIDNSILKLTPKIKDNYKLNEEIITAYIYQPVEVKISNINITGIKNYRNSAININYGKNVKINNLHIEKFGYSGIKLTNCYLSKIINSRIENISNENTGYGIQDFGSYNTNVERCFLKFCRRGVDFSGIIPSRDGIVRNCIIEGGGFAKNGTELIRNYGSSGLGTHGTAENIVFISNKITNVKSGFLLRGRNIKIKNNSLHGKIEMAICQIAGKNVFAYDNCYFLGKFDNTKNDYKYSILREFLRVGPKTSKGNKIEIINNDIMAIRGDFVYMKGLDEINDLIIKGNNIVFSSNSSRNAVSLLKYYKELKFQNIQILDNLVFIKRGLYTQRSVLD